MLKTIFKILFISISLLFFVKCDNYEFPESPYPRVETFSVVNISKTGVTFQANSTQKGNLPIINHGFVWSDTSYPTIDYNQGKVELGPISNLRNFEATVQFGFAQGKPYYVRAFIATSEYLIYCESASFTSK